MTGYADSAAISESARLGNMRVLIVSDAAPERNGVGAYYQDLTQYLQPRVAQLDIVCPVIQPDGRWKGGFNMPLPGDTTQRFLVPNFRRIERKVKRFTPDVVIVPTPGLMGLAGAYYARKHGATVVLGFHTWFEALAAMYWGRFEGALNRGYFWATNKLLFRWSDIVVANSDDMVAIAEEFGAKKSYRVGTPIAYNFLHRTAPAPVTRAQKILFAGRLAAEKNLPAIIDAAQRHPGLTFSISGDGPERATVEHAAATLPNLHYLGWLNRDALLREMDRNDCLVLPSHVESFGTVALEAMARGRIAVVSSHCGIAQWPELRKGLFIIEEGATLSDILHALQSMEPKLLTQKSAMARDAAEALNDWSMGMWYGLLDDLATP